MSHPFASQADARKTVEQWSEDEAAFMYFDDRARTQEWEPPPSGYLRRDGLLVLTNGAVCEDPDNVLGDAEKARNAAEAAAAHLLGLLSAEASKPLSDLQTFLEERLALEGGDVRMVQDGAGKACDVGQLQTAPLSVVSHSFRLISRRAIISRSDLDRECLSLERARAEHPR